MLMHKGGSFILHKDSIVVVKEMNVLHLNGADRYFFTIRQQHSFQLLDVLEVVQLSGLIDEEKTQLLDADVGSPISGGVHEHNTWGVLLLLLLLYEPTERAWSQLEELSHLEGDNNHVNSIGWPTLSIQ